MLLLDLRNQLSLDKCNWEDVHYYGTILDTNHKILDWNRDFWRHARRWGGSAGEGREIWRGGLRCGNVPVQNNVNRFLFQKAKYHFNSYSLKSRWIVAKCLPSHEVAR